APISARPIADLTVLQRLEAESIHIMREVVAECERPVMLYSIGKDSSVMLHLAMKAFFPAKPPFPFLHIDTTWKFREMIEFRDRFAKENGIELIVHTNQEGLRENINPFDHGSQKYTHVMKTQALLQAITKGGFDAAFGGARRDGMLLMVDDARLPLEPGEKPVMTSVRFRTLGCYPLTGADVSTAQTLPEIIGEMLETRNSERSGRLIDHDEDASMETKKRE